MDEAIQILRKEANMFSIILLIPLALWVLGLLIGYTMGGMIHILPVLAFVIGLTRVIQGLRITKEIAAIWAR
jgi:hypothetical protein